MHKRARIERKRRFLLDGFPANAQLERTRRITDYYIHDTTLRLRAQSEEHGPLEGLVLAEAEFDSAAMPMR